MSTWTDPHRDYLDRGNDAAERRDRIADDHARHGAGLPQTWRITRARKRIAEGDGYDSQHVNDIAAERLAADVDRSESC